MWNLVQLDLFHRLINNKPPAFPFDLNNWRVNLPWLAFDSAPGRDEAVPAMAFLARSRITLILIGFFQALGKLNNDGGGDTLSTIQPLCMQVEQVFEEWRIVSGPNPSPGPATTNRPCPDSDGQEEWLGSSHSDSLNEWSISELALSGYTCVLFMLGRATLPSRTEGQPPLDSSDMIPKSDLSMRAARKVVDIVYHMVHVARLPGPESLSCALGTYRAYVAYAHLASGLASEPDAVTAPDDLLRLKQFAGCVQSVARSEREFMPLARALEVVYNSVETRVPRRSP
jgi:hypothetical protein